MTPLWLKTHASYIDSYYSMADHQIKFNAGAIDRALLLKVLLVAAGPVTDETPLAVEIRDRSFFMSMGGLVGFG